MMMIVVDTDHISVLQHQDSPYAKGLRERIESVESDEVVTTVATYEEQVRSWLSQIARHADVHRQIPFWADSRSPRRELGTERLALCSFTPSWPDLVVGQVRDYDRGGCLEGPQLLTAVDIPQFDFADGTATGQRFPVG